MTIHKFIRGKGLIPKSPLFSGGASGAVIKVLNPRPIPYENNMPRRTRAPGSAAGLLIGFAILFFLITSSLSAQSHVSVSVDDPVYYVLEMAELRGLCEPLPMVKPYSRSVIVQAINEILGHEASAGLSADERQILEDIKERLGKAPKTGFNWLRGVYHLAPQNKKGETFFSGDIGISFRTLVAGGLFIEDNTTDVGTDTWGTGYTNGDIGSHFSFDFSFSMGFIRAPVKSNGEGVDDKYHTYYANYNNLSPEWPYTSHPQLPYVSQQIETSSEPMVFFPYTFRKNWDAFVFGSGDTVIGYRERWPSKRGMGYSIQSELSGEFFDGAFGIRAGRMRREWGAMAEGSSLVFNSHAQPFLGIEATFRPIYWFSLSTLTGVLEYYNSDGLGSAWNSQNAFSIGQLELNHKNYFHFDIGTSVVWPKRFELGYIYPLANNFFYQNNIGDFDNLTTYFNVKGQYPGLASIWFSFFVDEIDVNGLSQLATLDRQMFALQGGVKFAIPWLPFSSIKLSYTKIEPYTYTHQRIFTPWYDSGNTSMSSYADYETAARETKALETSYTNNGVGLGYYLPPNSDEILFRFETRPTVRTKAHFQYQMIRHGADHGPNQVDGSSYLSELDPTGRDTKPELKKNFLHDGAYQWMHIGKVGVEHTVDGLPLKGFFETGVVYSYYTNYDAVNEAHYPTATSFIMTIGFHVFPR
jgi:hypothetical protein